MSENTKQIPIDPVLESNAKSATIVVETFVTKDGTSFFVIRNERGQVAKVLNTSADLAEFFNKLIDAIDNGSQD